MITYSSVCQDSYDTHTGLHVTCHPCMSPLYVTPTCHMTYLMLYRLVYSAALLNVHHARLNVHGAQCTRGSMYTRLNVHEALCTRGSMYCTYNVEPRIYIVTTLTDVIIKALKLIKLQ